MEETEVRSGILTVTAEKERKICKVLSFEFYELQWKKEIASITGFQNDTFEARGVVGCGEAILPLKNDSNNKNSSNGNCKEDNKNNHNHNNNNSNSSSCNNSDNSNDNVSNTRPRLRTPYCFWELLPK